MLRTLFLSCCALSVLCARQTPATSSRKFPKPPHEGDPALMARWLVHVNEWGTLATQGKEGAPVGGVVSHSDGTWESPNPRIFFYLTPMDELVQNLVSMSNQASYTLSEAQIPHACKGTDPEDPVCAKATLLGTMERVANKDLELAKLAMYSRHPAMEDWPSGHNWQLWELKVDEIHLLDWYGGMKVIEGEDYYNTRL